MYVIINTESHAVLGTWLTGEDALAWGQESKLGADWAVQELEEKNMPSIPKLTTHTKIKENNDK
jgi:hypothetical protein